MKEKQRRREIEKNKLRHKARGLSEGKQIEEEIQESVPCKNLQTKPSMPFTLSLFSFSSISFPTLHVNHMYSLNKFFFYQNSGKKILKQNKKKAKKQKTKNGFYVWKIQNLSGKKHHTQTKIKKIVSLLLLPQLSFFTSRLSRSESMEPPAASKRRFQDPFRSFPPASSLSFSLFLCSQI